MAKIDVTYAFQNIMNNEEIDRIECPELRQIKLKYWKLKHNTFIDEHNIPDTELLLVSDKLYEKEKEELLAYAKAKGFEIPTFNY